jgi:hypothetical protein
MSLPLLLCDAGREVSGTGGADTFQLRLTDRALPPLFRLAVYYIARTYKPVTDSPNSVR